MRCGHYANKHRNILLFMIFSTPAIKARFPFDILVHNVIYRKRLKIPWNTHISITNSFILRRTICLRFAIVLGCQQFLHNDRFYEACYIGLSIKQCKIQMLVHDWNKKVLLIDQVYLAQMWWIEMLFKNKTAFCFKKKVF